MKRSAIASAGAVMAFACAATAHGQVFLGPTPYLCASDSPWDTGAPDFYLENFEDGVLNVPGVSGNGSVTGPGGITDSVECDDGVIDGSGRLGRSYFGAGNPGLTFIFTADSSGRLPVRAGIVWTDGVHNSTPNSVHFEAFGPLGQFLGTIAGTHADNSQGSETAEDRFYGVEYAEGISRFRIYQTAGCCGIEVDHLQYGYSVRCLADFNDDGGVDGFDVEAFFDSWSAGSFDADVNDDGGVDGEDVAVFFSRWEAGC